MFRSYTVNFGKYVTYVVWREFVKENENKRKSGKKKEERGKKN
jgi:hypothetical protein